VGSPESGQKEHKRAHLEGEEDIKQPDRREFILQCSRWVAGAGALYLAGTFISCSSKEKSTEVVSDKDSVTAGGGTSAAEDGQASVNEDQGSSNNVVKVNGECIACGKYAWGICSYDAISMAGDRAVISEACRGYGICIGPVPWGLSNPPPPYDADHTFCRRFANNDTASIVLTEEVLLREVWIAASSDAATTTYSHTLHGYVPQEKQSDQSGSTADAGQGHGWTWMR
jgi:hypothetical protein